MKKILVLFCLVIGMYSSAEAQDIKFKETSFKFGKIKQHVPATHIFTFTNTGGKPAVIEFANAECGCTKPEYSQSPIMKGKSSTVKVTYNSETPGTFTKKVHVKFADLDLPITLTIEGEVIAKK